MSVIEKILHFIAYKKVSINEFSKLIGVSNGYLAKQKANKGNIGSHIIEKIVRLYPDLNIDWLFGIDDQMLKTKPNENATLNKGGIDGGKKGGIPKINKTPPLEPCPSCEAKDERLAYQGELISMLRQQVSDKEEIISHLKALLEMARKGPDSGENGHSSSKAS